MTTSGAAGYAFDNSPPDGSLGVLAGFVGGAQNLLYGPMSLGQRRTAVLQHYASVFGDNRFLAPVEYFDMDWTNEEWSRGAPTALDRDRDRDRDAGRLRTRPAGTGWTDPLV